VLLTKGRKVSIEAVRIETSGDSSITSFDTQPTTAPGAPGGQVILTIYDRIQGHLTIDLRGASGGKGADGQPGLKGANDAPGENAASSVFDGKHGGGTGGRGLQGSPGFDGLPGGQGGDGGTLVLKVSNPEEVAGSIAFSAAGGPGGGTWIKGNISDPQIQQVLLIPIALFMIGGIAYGLYGSLGKAIKILFIAFLAVCFGLLLPVLKSAIYPVGDRESAAY
jgi:hypothetical protein